MYSDHGKLLKDLGSGKVALREVVEQYLDKIEKGKQLNAFLSVFPDEALERADMVGEKIKKGTAGKLAGMVIAVKDVLSIKDKKLTCASNILGNFTALYTSTPVQRLMDEDAIVIGKTNCDEFAMGSSNENSAYGAVKNPADLSRVPGGSSGGSAAAVASGMCAAALGTDTGGSVRQPASFCGIVGFKPTYGRVSRYGLTAFASSFDTVGVFSGNVNDAAKVMEVISGHDKLDSTSSEKPVPSYSESLKEPLESGSITVGLAAELLGEGLQSEIRDAVNNTAEKLREKGFKVKSVKLPHSKYVIQTYYILTTAEASSNLARYDGARYGRRSESSASIEDMYVNSRTEGFGMEVKRRIMLGTYVLSAGYYDAYYKKAQKARRLIREDFQKAFGQADVILMPTTPTTAFKIGEKIDDPLAMYLNDVYTTSANLTGGPAVSIPAGKDSSGLPVGIQLMGRDFDETTVLRLADYIMRNC